MRYKTQDILKCANNFTKRSLELEKEADDMEIEINSLNKVYILYFNTLLMYKYGNVSLQS